MTPLPGRWCPRDTEGMSNRAIIVVVAWSFLALGVEFAWSHWTGAVQTTRHVIDGVRVHGTIVDAKKHTPILIATAAVWAAGAGAIVLLDKRRKKSSPDTSSLPSRDPSSDECSD